MGFATGQSDDGLVQQEQFFFGVERTGGFLQTFCGVLQVAGAPGLQAGVVLFCELRQPEARQQATSSSTVRTD